MTDKSAGEALLAELEDVYDAVYNDEYTGKGSTASASSRAAIRAVIERHEALRASPQPSEQAIDLPTHMNAMCEHLCARISNWIGAVAVNGSLSGTADDACKELLRNTFTALQNELTYLKALREADEPVAPDDDADIAALHRALEVYSSVCGEVADTASLAAVITDRRSMCTAAPVAAGSAAITEAVVAKGCAAEIEHEKLPLDHRHYMRRTNRVRAILEGAFMGDPPQDVSVEYYQSLPIVEDRTAHPEPAAAGPVANPPLPWIQVVAAKFVEFKSSWPTEQQIAWFTAFKTLIESGPPSASAPSQPSEGPARVTELHALAAKWRQQHGGPEWHEFISNSYGACADELDAALAAAEGKGK